jgi:hypothetical protein
MLVLSFCYLIFPAHCKQCMVALLADCLRILDILDYTQLDIYNTPPARMRRGRLPCGIMEA